MSNIIFHIDVNNAFLSWSAVDMLKKGYPVDLRNVASAVAGDPTLRHGVILAKSTIAKKMGVKTGESIAEARKKCKNLQLTPPNHELYNSESNKLKKLLEKYTDKIEQFSIDEFFIEYIPALGPYMTVAQNIQDEITNTLGITVNIGISTNKLLAKMASDFEKPNKIHTLFPDEIKSKMWPLPVGELIFCGNSAQKKLNLIGIKTIGDLAKSSKDTIYRLLKNPGLQLYEYAKLIFLSEKFDEFKLFYNEKVIKLKELETNINAKYAIAVVNRNIFYKVFLKIKRLFYKGFSPETIK